MGLEPIPIDISRYQLLYIDSLNTLEFQRLTHQRVEIVGVVLKIILRKVCHLTATRGIIKIPGFRRDKCFLSLKISNNITKAKPFAQQQAQKKQA